ncbi:S-adenosyl-L-methionine-dependent methyltransferase [Dacryopinax primogenitus]|uniref:S-adenosyl-L-methionine-dependent methyltransferase n=1 Tax=Dacryopinax primogenitus (strain DJM 731) TaxID=1858805 RepID=M5GCZ5_DACPD|nr:S-adenosyl-L-methionine-dependent methyltransferase [Dacryopinax primogenitus]EJU06520.1 S-adenosyl-L-methionine-dependent methyltransferase [Dacryopinax primogenitus]
MSTASLSACPPATFSGVDRYYTAETYLLPHDEDERERLQLQHDMLMKYTKSLIPPSLVLADGDKVLDAGTGSGVWLLEVARMVPSTIALTGIDIEKRLFPQPSSNTKFMVQTTLSLPEGWNSRFALVHQRLMVAAFSREAWKACISEFFRVLQPGGWLQLEEIDFLGVLEEAEIPPLTHRFWMGARVLCEARGVSSDCLLRIPDLLEEAGFTALRMIKTRIPYGSDKSARRAGIGAWKGMKAPFLKAGGFDVARTSEEYDDFMDQVENEWRRLHFKRTYATWTARKPL